MSTTTVQTQTEATPSTTLKLRSSAPEEKPESEEYRYSNLLPVFSQDHYPPLTPFEHSDPGHRALKHSNPRSFLDNATSVVEITPNLGTEVQGVNLRTLDSDARDQLALEVKDILETVPKLFVLILASRLPVEVLSSSETNKTLLMLALIFILNGAAILDGRFPSLSPLQYANSDFWISLHIHPTSGHPNNYPEVHLVYRDANSTFNFEIADSITSTFWHSDVSYELQPPGLTTFFLLAQPSTGGDTLFTSQVSALKKLSPQFVAFLKTLKAVHSGVEQANFSRSGKRGGIVRREPGKSGDTVCIRRLKFVS